MATVPEQLEYLTEDELYPSSDGEPLGETGLHVVATTKLFCCLLNHFAGKEVLVTNNLFWYWEKGNPEACYAPDIMVVKGVSNEPRKTFLSWKEKVSAPCTIFEMTSEETKKKDLIKKKADYQWLGVKEYFLFDPLKCELEIPFQGFRLRKKEYVPIKPDKEGSLESKQLNLLFQEEGFYLRVIDKETGNKLPNYDEESQRRQLVEIEKKAAEKRAREAEERARQLEEELARLKSSRKKS